MSIAHTHTLSVSSVHMCFMPDVNTMNLECIWRRNQLLFFYC